MHLRNEDGSEFSLAVEGYQFPENLDNKWDANWLVISISVKTPRGAWEARGPYLLQWEAEQLATWLEGMTKGASFGKRIEFTEPDLEFECRAGPPDRLSLRVGFNAEFRPPWSDRSPSRVVGEGTFVDFTLSPEDLLDAARALRSDVAPFPMRKVQGK